MASALRHTPSFVANAADHERGKVACRHRPNRAMSLWQQGTLEIDERTQNNVGDSVSDDFRIV